MTTSKPSSAGEGTVAAGASFRDPGGTLQLVAGIPYRFVRNGYAPELRAFLGSDIAQQWTATGSLVESAELGPTDVLALRAEPAFASTVDSESWGGVWEHAPVFFPSTVEEWTPGMLHRAGTLTLQLAAGLLKSGRGLKDATPANVLFRGAQPVFVDLLSIEMRAATDPLWLPYAQFVRTFLLPLLVSKTTSLPLRSSFGIGREGLEPEMARGLLPFGARWSSPGLWLVTAPSLLSGSRKETNDSAPPLRSVPAEQAEFVLRRLFRQLQGSLDAVAPAGVKESAWTGYVVDHHSPAYFDAKRAFVASVVAERQPKSVLDIGCNTGELSIMAAAGGATVVAIDNDPHVVERVFQRAAAAQQNILPLVVDLAAPTPGRGWMNAESPSFLDRARGKFDVVLAMAVIHHLIATNGVPLREVLRLFSHLTRDTVALEFVPPSDPLFRRLARGRDALYSWITRAAFEEECRRYFDVVRCEPLPSGERVAYVLRKRG